MDQTDPFVAYVNTYYAVQEGLERARRNGPVAPKDDALAFVREADPFLWDGEASADRSLFEGYAREFERRFGAKTAAPNDTYDLARDWLGTLERKRFGSGLLEAFDSVADRDTFVGSFDAVRDQVLLRREMSEWYPQEEPEAPREDAPEAPPAPELLDPSLQVTGGTDGVVSATSSDAERIAELVAPRDVELQTAIAGYARRQMSSDGLLQWLLMRDGTALATAGLLVVTLPPTSASGRRDRVVGLVTLCGGQDKALSELLDAIRAQAANWGVGEVQDGGLAR